MPKDAENIKDEKIIICSWCGQPTQIIWVHGHGQCSSCGTNIDECCRGEQCHNTLPRTYISGTDNNQ